MLLFHTPAVVKLLTMVGLFFLPLTFFKEMLNRKNQKSDTPTIVKHLCFSFLLF